MKDVVLDPALLVIFLFKKIMKKEQKRKREKVKIYKGVE